MPYVLDDSEVNTPVFSDWLSEIQTVRANGTETSFSKRRRKPRKPTISNRLRLIQDPDVKAKVIEVLQQAQFFAVSRSVAPKPSPKRRKKYRFVTPRIVLTSSTSGSAENQDDTVREETRPPK